MAENVQCPVCTLYLHAGMNLSDHLETHPKEQVIRALVQMTISGGGGNGNNNALASVLAGESSNVGNDAKKPTVELEEKPLTNIKDNELSVGSVGNSCSSSASNSTSSCSLSNQSASSNQNSNNVLNFSSNNIERYNECERDRRTQSPAPVSHKTAVKKETNLAATAKDTAVVVNENVSECFTKQTLNQSNSNSSSTANVSHSYHPAPVELSNQNNIHNFTVFSGNQRYDQQLRTGVNSQNQLHTAPHMPPPPPPTSSQNQHPGQHQEINRGVVPAGHSGTFHSMQPQQFQPPLPPPHHTSSHLSNASNSQRHPHMFAGQHQPQSNSHHQQSLKVIYTPTLPPPPPLQLFTYQPQTHVQHHQKPPPAYGTAISQIRSQHNQNKQQVAGSLASQRHQQTLQAHSVLQQQQQQQQQQHQHQQHNLQQQSLHQNLRIHVPPPPPPLPIPTKHSYTPKNHELSTQHNAVTSRQSQSQQQQQQTKTDMPQQQQQQQQQHQQQQQQQQQHPNNTDSAHNSNNHSLNSNEISNKSIKAASIMSATGANHNSNTSAPLYPQVSISPSTTSASIAAVAASTLSRHTNSPFAALLAAAAGAPSPSNSSSVLRYAESPVAHYLERENGDFIVQETPKHIVECVETDNGEFSVIERIYQSPPSVLHIHDDDDEDDDNCSGKSVNAEQEDADSKNKHHGTNDDSDAGQTKHEAAENQIKSKISAKDDAELNKSNKKIKHIDHASGNNEIVDFVSISSDSGDEEECISQERKDYKNTTEINQKNEPSPTVLTPMPSAPILSSSTSSSSSSSSSSLTTTTANDDQQSTSNSTSSTSLHSTSSNTTQSQQQNSGVGTNGTNSRKKSSKNTITVLSDVQLNLNEYLDLVGNIIASSKVAAQRKTFASIAPMPLVKIEKEEPMDEYITTNSTNITTNFETPQPPTPLKANKHETEEITDTPSCSSSKHTNNNISLANEPDEQEEKKPQVFGNVSENGQKEITPALPTSNISSSLTAINSSHVTSVIRMASTSQHQPQQQHQLFNNKNSGEAEDLSQPQRKVQSMANSKSVNHTALARKGPKKLVIKPKSSKTEVLPTTNENKQKENPLNDDQQLPTTSAKARLEYIKQSPLEDAMHATDIQVKNEPITSIAYENLHQQQQYQQTTGFSILEHHLNSKEPILEFKEEKPCITEASVPPTTIIKEMKVENNVNDDARVLYNFANSKKTQCDPSPSFPSSSSLFSNKQTAAEMTTINKVQQQNKKLNHEIENSSSSSSTYSSQSAVDSTTSPDEEHNENSGTNGSIGTVQTQHQPNQVFTDFAFSYLYNNNDSNNMGPGQVEAKGQQQFTTFYQNADNNIGSNGTTLLEDSSSSKHYTDYQHQQQQPQQQQQQNQHHNHNQQQQHHQAGSSQQQWFNNNNYQTSETNVTSIPTNQSSNINNSLSVDGTAALDGVEVGKYLDLDTCKREQNIDMISGDRVTVPPPPPPSSSTSCSFNGATDNSMAGICSTATTLNIRTDEKMPAKGEISEQESNCDIDNSWSQPMYGDISARFFKTTFPGIFPHDNGWNQDEYFTVQDLSASTNAQAANSANNRLKSFEPNGSCNNNSGMPIFSQNSNDNCNIDVMPSTSAKIRKRRKRSSQDGRTPQASAKRMQPTSTVTSQQLMMEHQNEIESVEFNFQHQQSQHQQQQLLQHSLHQPSTSAAFLAGPSNASTALASSFMVQQQQQQNSQQLQVHQPQHQTQQKQRTKVYECGHCNAKYSKLKDRNAHMVDVHNYIRQNRRLVCPTTGLATSLTNADMQDIALPTTSAAGSILMPPLQNADCMGDYKQGIVKIENENIQRDLSAVEPIDANLSAKTEIMEDDKKNLALVSMNANNSSANLEYDTKPPTNSLPLSMTTPTSKLTTLYRMLVSFNMTTLKQNQSLSEFDENLIKSSIFFCYICRQNFNSVKFYDAHLTEHPAECFTCGKKFQRWKNFSLHLKRHLGWKEFGCTVCDKKFVVRSALVEHMRMHSGLSPLKCKICGKHFKRYSNLTQHRKRHTKQIVRRKEYVCYCGEVLPSKARFLWHKETHDSKPKCCPHCCDRFVHVNSLRRHIRLAHSDKFDYTEPMECPICKQIFAKASMKAHMATHSTETQYDCAICSKSFSTKWNLKIHSWVHANRTAKPFKCEHCPKAFVREVDFKNHMNSHKQIKPYTCEVCGCKFIRKYNYMRHRREHHGNKKYTCDLCKKSFHRHYYLIEHRRIHTGERPFQCSICGKSSTTKTNHNKHLKIHHSRDPFTVEV